MRQPLLLGLLYLPEQVGLVRRVMPDQDPPAGLVAHLPGEELMKNRSCNLNNADRVLNCCLTGINFLGLFIVTMNIHLIDEYTSH